MDAYILPGIPSTLHPGLSGRALGKQRGRPVPINAFALALGLLVLVGECRVQHDGEESGDQVGLFDNKHNGVEEATQSRVVALVGKDVVEPFGDTQRSEAQSESACGDEPVPAGPFGVCQNSDTRDSDGSEQESGEAAVSGRTQP